MGIHAITATARSSPVGAVPFEYVPRVRIIPRYDASCSYAA